MRRRPAETNYRATSMYFVAYLDEQRVEMCIGTETGAVIAVSCPLDSILRLRHSISRLDQDCPEIATWGDPIAGSITPTGAGHSTAA